MYSRRVQYALDYFIEENYFLPTENSYDLKEEKESGKSSLNVTIANDNLCIFDFDRKHKCNFLKKDRNIGLQKSVDHVLFERRTENWRLHLIEMKSSVGFKTWLLGIKPKVRTGYLNSLAIAEFLGIKITDVIAYTTYENEKFNKAESKANPRAIIPQLGLPARNPVEDEWDKNQMFLDLGEEIKIPHKKIQMIKNRETGVLEGTLKIE